jgi:4-hydroxybenzoate polyprenyltransferase
MQQTITKQTYSTAPISPTSSKHHQQPKQPHPSPSLTYHIHTLILFTHDQFFDTIIPGTLFSLLATLSGPSLSLPSLPLTTILLRAPLIATWLWLIILQFCLQNQCSTGSPAEDALNKPWRPIPSNRITLTNAKRLLLAAHVVAGVASWRLGVLAPWIAWTSFSTLYNDLGGSDCSGYIRNVFCGCFFTCSFGGALAISLGDVEISREAMWWTFLVCWCVLLTTIQTQEFRDEVGDKARGRKTMVTELGRTRGLWTVYVMVSFWSL